MSWLYTYQIWCYQLTWWSQLWNSGLWVIILLYIFRNRWYIGILLNILWFTGASNLNHIYIYMLRAIWNKSWRQHPTKHQLYGYLPPITKTIQVRQTRHCWRSRDELISDVLLWTLTYGRAKAGQLARTYIQQLCEDIGCSPEDLPEAIKVREKWRERIRDIRARGMTWWWYIYIRSGKNLKGTN